MMNALDSTMLKQRANDWQVKHAPLRVAFVSHKALCGLPARHEDSTLQLMQRFLRAAEPLLGAHQRKSCG